MAAAAQVGVEVDVVVDVVGAVTGSGLVVVLVSEPPPPQAVKMAKHKATSAVVQVLDFRIVMVVSVLNISKKVKSKNRKVQCLWLATSTQPCVACSVGR
jgi:hypothetical protein